MSLFKAITVQDVCRKNTILLEKIRSREEKRICKAQKQLEKVSNKKAAAEKQSTMAVKAIERFNEFFGLDD